MVASKKAAAPRRSSTRGRGRPRGSEPVADSQQIIAAAIRAVREFGPAVTMDAIAAEAGVSKPIVYRTVGDKAAVGVAVAEYLSRRVETMTAQHVGSEGDQRAQFSAAVRLFFEFLSEERQLFLFVEHGWRSPDGRQVELMIERSAQPFIAAFNESQMALHHSPNARRTWAYATVGSLRTVAVMWVRDNYCDLDEIVEHVTDHALRPYRQG